MRINFAAMLSEPTSASLDKLTCQTANSIQQKVFIGNKVSISFTTSVPNQGAKLFTGYSRDKTECTQILQSIEETTKLLYAFSLKYM
jgi:hypothetical protein